ncbi:MAG TPA: MnhB domain-containing protein [Actinomycetospora sp.]|uniref:MnhB domain-containing protein n=1 Tax=Actinomycetospora sp. TaxID=1872135 RepID=UPI002F3EA749
MSRRARLVLFGLGAVGLAVLWVVATGGLPPVGTDVHPYRDAAVAAAAAHATANVVASINFDQRAVDTLGEETILLASVVAVTTLLRPADDERVEPPDPPPAVLPATRVAGWALLPVTLLVGADVVLHGHLTPGGGFQGGVVLATALHLLYLAGSFPALQWVRPTRWAPLVEPAGSGLFVVTGLVGLAAGAGFAANILPTGVLGAPLSSGTVLVLNVVAGIGVGASIVTLLGQFLRQEVVIGPEAAS